MLEITAPDYPSEDPILTTLDEFLEANEELDPEDRRAVETLPVGGEIRFGGGAAVLFVVRRTS